MKKLLYLAVAAAFLSPALAFAQTATNTPVNTVTKTMTPTTAPTQTKTPTAPKNDESTDIHALQMDDYSTGPYPTPKKSNKCIAYFNGGKLFSICPGGTPVAY